MISIPLAKFDQDVLERLFSAYVLTNKSHWHCPSLDQINQDIAENGFYAYTAGQPDRWSSKFIVMLEKSDIRIDIQINKELPAGMQKMLENMRQETIERMEVIASRL